MDFEQLILTALTAKFPGVEAKVLGRIAKKHAKTASNEDDVKTIVDGITLQQVIDSYADARATEAQQTAVANYEKKHGLKDGKHVETETPAPTTPTQNPSKQTQTRTKSEDEIPAWAQALVEGQRRINERLDAADQEKAAKSRLDTFKDAIASAPETVRRRYERDFTRLTFKDDEDFQSYLDEIKPDIEAMAKEATTKGASVSKPKGGGGTTTQASPLVQQRINEKAAETVAPAIYGLPSTPKAN